MKYIDIITNSFLNINDYSIGIGGLQTYVYNLAILGKKINAKVVVYQSGIKNVDLVYEGIEIKIRKYKKTVFKRLYENLIKENLGSKIIIIATDQLNLKAKSNNTITIQHGIAFDYPIEFVNKRLFKNITLFSAIKFLRNLRNIFRYHNSRTLVCVDYNYYNWLKTVYTVDNKIHVIPNFCSELLPKDDVICKLTNRKSFSILFARRFCDYRGIKLFANCAMRLLKNNPEILVTFAGDGPLEPYLHQLFDKNSQVEITKFDAKDSMLFHSNYDIAVVPSFFSEGTSLSLLEAMGAGCYVVASHVGGMTNLIIDDYNGSLIYPDEDSLYNELTRLFDLDSDKFNNVVLNGYETVSQALSIRNWQEKWLEIFDAVMKGNSQKF